MAKNPGLILQIEGGGKAFAYHSEQQPEFAKLKKHFIHYITYDYKPVMVDGLAKKGLKDSSKLTIVGYLD